MQITLYKTGSERHALRKELTSGVVLSGALREESNVINPTFTIRHENPTEFNYLYVTDFGRYYFITEMKSVRTNIWSISCSVDVLMSFQQGILNLNVTVSDLSYGEPNASVYMDGEQWKATVKTKTDVIQFPQGLLDSGEYILITSGGVVS